MSNISSWVLSICGIVCVGVIVDVILPNKKNTSIVKTVVALSTILMIIKPIVKIDLNKINFDNITSQIKVDNKFVDVRNTEKLKALSGAIEMELNKNGYKNVLISFSIDNEKLLIKSVFVDLSKLVLSGENLNINKYTNIVAIVQQFVNINQGQVIFNE